MTFQVYRVETTFTPICEAERLSAGRLIIYVMKILRDNDTDDRRWPNEAMAVIQKYHPMSDSCSNRSRCMDERDVIPLAKACNCTVEELVQRAAVYWDEHDAKFGATLETVKAALKKLHDK